MSDEMRPIELEEFLAGTIAVKELIWGTVRPAGAPEEGREKGYLVAVLDTEAFPLINVTDLARLHIPRDAQRDALSRRSGSKPPLLTLLLLQ